MSQKTGVAPVWTIVFAAATKLSEGTSTSSPGPQPTASSARWSAAVPFATASAWLDAAELGEGLLELGHARPHAPPARCDGVRGRADELVVRRHVGKRYVPATLGHSSEPS